MIRIRIDGKKTCNDMIRLLSPVQVGVLQAVATAGVKECTYV